MAHTLTTPSQVVRHCLCFCAGMLLAYSWQVADLGSLDNLAIISRRTQHHDESVLTETLWENANKKIAERRAWLSKEHTEGRFFAALEGVSMWYMFGPVMSCIWDFEKEPSSALKHDGGKWLCGMRQVHEARGIEGKEYGAGKERYEKNCVVYSMGSNDDFTFEKRVRMLAPGCEIHTFDPTVRETGNGKGAYDVYHGDFGFGSQDHPSSGPFPVKSIATIMKELGHNHVDYLKVDVEGFEWGFFDEVDWANTKVGQILVELHPPKHSNANIVNRYFNKLEEAGFCLISLEPVTRTNYGQVEVVFLHKNWQPDGNW